jgi:hypothetical protein
MTGRLARGCGFGERRVKPYRSPYGMKGLHMHAGALEWGPSRSDGKVNASPSGGWEAVIGDL